MRICYISEYLNVGPDLCLLRDLTRFKGILSIYVCTGNILKRPAGFIGIYSSM